MARFLTAMAMLALALSALTPLPGTAGAPAFAGRFNTAQQIKAPDCMALLWSQKPGDSYGCTAQQVAAWRADITAWRSDRLKALRYDGSRYANPALAWTQSSFVQPQAMLHDRYLYDSATGTYTVGRYLDDVRRRYGGIDSVLLWSIYPNIGIDNRNQLDMIEHLPGGKEGVKRLVADFQKEGVKVLFPVMPWDTGTAEPAQPLPEALAALMKELGADGVNGDTMTGVPEKFSLAAEAIGHPLAFEPEIAPQETQLGWNLMTWGYFDYPYAIQNPGVHLSKLKWLDTRHMVHINDRWQRDRRHMLQFAFFNGTGFESWENIWGIWNGLTPRDSEALRRIATIQRAMAPHLVSPEWEPLSATSQFGVLASRWPLAGKQLWTVVNRNEYAVSGEQLRLSPQPGMRYFDVYHGVELLPRANPDGTVSLSFGMEAYGYGAVLAQAGGAGPGLARLLETMRSMTRQPLAGFRDAWQALPQTMRANPRTPAAARAPEGMVTIPAADFPFRVHGVAVEGINMEGADVQFPWEASPRRFHHRTLRLPAFHMDVHPVTNAEYQRFVDASGYRPRDTQNYLRHWTGGRASAQQADQPVVWVSPDDARAYASWAGKRLPTTWEWQYAAQGLDGRIYPWGNEWDPAAAPAPDQRRQPGPPPPVGQHPRGASPFGVMDLVGHVWQWTDEFEDQHTRSALLRGGSYYRPQGSHWYFPQSLRLDTHGKFLLMAPSMDRNASTGFRCVRDAGGAAAPDATLVLNP